MNFELEIKLSHDPACGNWSHMIHLCNPQDSFIIESNIKYNTWSALCFSTTAFLILFFHFSQQSVFVAAILSAVVTFPLMIASVLIHPLIKPIVRITNEHISVIPGGGVSFYGFKRPIRECKIRVNNKGDIVVQFFPWISNVIPGGALPSKMILDSKASDYQRLIDILASQVSELRPSALIEERPRALGLERTRETPDERQ